MWGPPGLVPGDAAPPPHWGRPAEGRRRPPRCESETGAAQKGPWRQMGTLLPLSPPRAQWWPWHLRGSRGGGVGGQHWGGSVAPPCVPPPPFLPVPTSHISCPHIPLCPTSHVPAFPFPPSPRPRCPCPTSSCPPVPKSRPPHILNLMSPYPISHIPMSPSPRSFVLSPYVASLSPCPPIS